MYIIDSYINAKNVKVMNHHLYHGLLLNRDEAISGPSLPGKETIPYQCIHNCFGGPRIVMIGVRLAIPESLLKLMPKNDGCEYQKIVTTKWICQDYSVDFGPFIEKWCPRERAYRKDPDAFMKKYVTEMPENRAKWATDLFQMKVFPIRFLPDSLVQMEKYKVVRGHLRRVDES